MQPKLSHKMKSKQRYTLFFIIIVVTIDTMSFGVIFPVLPQLLSTLLSSSMSTAAKYGGWLAFSYAFMQFICAPLLGNLSDRYGRRPVLLSSLLGFSIDCVFIAFAPSIFWLFIGRIIAGITGASFSVASACIGDISTDDNRTKNFGFINAAFGAGFILGPAIGGVLGQWGSQIPFIFSAILSLLNFIFGYFLFSESLAKENRRKFEWKRVHPLGALGQLKKFPIVWKLILSMFFISIANHSMESVWAFFTIEKFNWSNIDVGYSLAVIGALSIIVQIWGVGYVIKLIGEYKMLLFGLFLTCVGFFLFALASVPLLIYIGIIVFILGGIQGTAMQSIISSAVSAREQGALQGALGCLLGLTTFIAPPIMTSAFSYFTNDDVTFYFPGMPFFLAGSLALISLVLCLYNFPKYSNRSLKVK